MQGVGFVSNKTVTGARKKARFGWVFLKSALKLVEAKKGCKKHGVNAPKKCQKTMIFSHGFLNKRPTITLRHHLRVPCLRAQ